MAAWKTEFQKLYDAATSSDDGKIVQLVDRMMSILKANGQSQVVLLPNACVGLHPKNRGVGCFRMLIAIQKVLLSKA